MIVCLRTVVVPPERRDRYLAWSHRARPITAASDKQEEPS